MIDRHLSTIIISLINSNDNKVVLVEYVLFSFHCLKHHIQNNNGGS